MNIDQLKSGLEAKFQSSRIVFWHDPERDFSDEIADLDLNNVQILDMAGTSNLEIKKRIELDEPQRAFLLYFPWDVPPPENDWLLDIRLYGEAFYADINSMLLGDLGISKMGLRAHLQQRQAFFANKQRIAALKRFITEDEDEDSLDRKMIAVVVKADSASVADILLALLRDYADSIGTEPVSVPLFDQLEKYGLDQSFWQFCRHHFGYIVEQPCLPDFVLKLFCTELWKQIDAGNRDWLNHHLLSSAAGVSTALAFMGSWRDSRTFAPSYETIAGYLEKKLEIIDACSHYQPKELQECETFEGIERVLIRGLVNALLDSAKVLDQTQFSAVLSRRASCYWVQSHPGYRAIYRSLASAQQLLMLRQKYVDGFHFASVKKMYQAYTEDLFKFDQHYRLFRENIHELLARGAEVLHQLEEEIENLYSHWFLFEFGIAWDRLIEKEDFIQSWRLPQINRQEEFYRTRITEFFKGGTSRRVFVVISDALRYEVAHELTSSINNEKRFLAKLDSQLGLLPSNTALGKAALLPHKLLHYRQGQETVLVDGVSTHGLDNRNRILKSEEGIAVDYKEVLKWRNQEGRDIIKDASVVYIYHDAIDDTGDKAASEEGTFTACREAIEELKVLVSRIINRLNGSRVIITADHGFIYQHRPLEQTDKSALLAVPPGAIVSKKRYILGHQLPSLSGCWKGIAAPCEEGQPAMEFLVPKGTQRFHFVGGAKFIHGGAMPQEICVPVVEVRELQKKQAELFEKKQVGVVLATTPVKIVNNIDKLRFIQTDAVGERFSPRTLEIYIIDGDNQAVSSRELVTFDSTAAAMDERIRDMRIKLMGAQFDRLARYTLVLENAGTRTRYEQYAVTIDLAFNDDFF